MSTRCFVGLHNGGKFQSIYVHYDGYPSGVGAELQEYTTADAVAELISGGDRSGLKEGLYRDRGEAWEDVKPAEYITLDELVSSCEQSWGEWYYIFQDAQWLCGSTSRSNPLYGKLVPWSADLDG